MSTADDTGLGPLFHKCGEPGCREFGMFGFGSKSMIVWKCAEHHLSGSISIPSDRQARS